MNTFEINIQRRSGSAWPVVVEQAAVGSILSQRSEGCLELDLDVLRSAPSAEYGALLGQALFRDRVLRAFDRARTESHDELHVLLHVEAEELKSVRWERLCAPLDGGSWSSLALDQRVPFSLYLPSVTDRRFPSIGRRELRALIVVASPTDSADWKLPAFDVPAAVANARNAMNPIPADVLAMIAGSAGPPTLDSLCAQITGQHYTLLHVVSHGRLLQDRGKAGETVLYLSKAGGEADPVTASRLIERLGKLRGAKGLPHLVFLSCCESAEPEAEGALGGLGQRLVRELGMPAVVAMTDRISVETAFALASGFYQRLREHGLVDRALTEAYASVAERQDVRVPVPALYTRLAGQPLFNLAPATTLRPAEIAHGLERLEQFLAREDAPRAPALFESEFYQTQTTALRGFLGAEDAQLSSEAREQKARALAEISRLCEECLDLSFPALADDQEPPAYQAECPFPGLASFKPHDRKYFFGRTAWVQQLREHLTQHNFLAVLGPSGSGKSSVVLAGLIPSLQDEDPRLQMNCLTPGSHPSMTLDGATMPRAVDLDSLNPKPKATAPNGMDRPSAPPAIAFGFGLNDASNRAEREGSAGLPDQAGTVILVVDQFEELFTLCTTKADRQEFLDRLFELSQTTRVVITMRADFWGECAEYDGLRDEMLHHQVLIPPMKLDGLREAIRMQAQTAGLRFETGLLGTILDDVQDQPGAMPLVQHALLELWNRRHGRWLKHEEYQAIGCVQGAIAKTADSVYASLPSNEHRDRMREIFLRLTRLDDEAKQSEPRRDTRQRAFLDELTPAGGDPADTKALVKRLGDARLVVTGADGATGREEVEVAHEALIRHWPTLGAWLDEDREALRLRAAITDSARQWDSEARDKSLLVWQGARLEEALRLAARPRFAINQREMDYLNTCSNEERRRRSRRVALRVLGAGTAVVVAALLLGYWVQRGRVETERVHAEQESRLKDVAMDQAERAWIAEKETYYLSSVMRYAADMGLAQQAMNDGHFVEMKKRLVRHQPGLEDDDLRHFEWYHLWRLARRDRVPLGGHADAVTAMACSPAAGLLATGGKEGRVHVWNIKTKADSWEPGVTSGEVHCLAFSPDGRTLAWGSDDGQLVWHDPRDRTCESTRLAAAAVRGLVFSPDGTRLAVAAQRNRSFDDTVFLFHVEDRALLHEIPQDAVVKAIGFRTSKELLLIVTSEGASRGLTNDAKAVLKRLDLTGPGAKELASTALGSVNNVTINADGSEVAIADQQTIAIWNVAEGRAARELASENGRVGRIAFGPDGRKVAALTGMPQADRFTERQRTCDGTVISVWDEGGKTVQRIPTEAAWFSALAWIGSCDHCLAWGQEDGKVVVYSEAAEPAKTDLPKGIGQVIWVAAAADSSYAAAAWQYAVDPPNPAAAVTRQRVELKVFDTNRPGTPVVPPIEFDEPGALRGALEGKHLAVIDKDGSFRVWDLDQRRMICASTPGETPASALALSHNGMIMAVAGNHGPIRLWDLATGQSPRSLGGEGPPVTALGFHPSLPYLAVARQGVVSVWSHATGERLATLQDGDASFDRVSFGRDHRLRIKKGMVWTYGDLVVACAGPGQVSIWSMLAGDRILDRSQPSYWTRAQTAISADGRRVAVGVLRGKVKIWEVEHQQELLTLDSPDSVVSAIAFSADAKTVAAGFKSGEVRLWHAATDPEIAE